MSRGLEYKTGMGESVLKAQAKKVEELKALNRRLTERWEGAKLRYAEDSKRIEQLEAEQAACNHFLREAGLGTDMPTKYAELEAAIEQAKSRCNELIEEDASHLDDITWIKEALELAIAFISDEHLPAYHQAAQEQSNE